MLKGKRSVTPSRDKDKGKKSSDSASSSPNKQSNNSNLSNMSNNSANNDNSVNNNPVTSAPNPWNDIVRETILSAVNPEVLYFRLIGGADEGQFPHVGQIVCSPEDVQVEVRGSGLAEGDVLLEIQGQKVSGYTGQDVEGWLKHCLSNGNMVVIRAVPQGRLFDLKY